MPARVYNPRRGRAHIAESGNSFVTFCGRTNFAGWYGTGSQAEYEEAAKRRLCKRCEKRVTWRSS